MATKVSAVYCGECNERLNRIVAGNIIDFTHKDGTYGCTESLAVREPEHALAA